MNSKTFHSNLIPINLEFKIFNIKLLEKTVLLVLVNPMNVIMLKLKVAAKKQVEGNEQFKLGLSLLKMILLLK